MRSAIKQKVLDLLTNAVIIDDDFSFLNVKDSVDLDNVLRSEPYAGKAPMKGTLRYERSEPDSDDPVAGDDRYKMKKLRGFLELFKNAGILPIPLFYTEEQEQEKSMIRACMNLTDFSVVDYSLINKDTSGITIIKENIENPDLINPVIIFTKGDKGRVERALEIDGDFERVSTFVTPPCFRHKKHPGLFIHVYCKTEFDPAPARDNLAEYIISHFELYSILVMAFNSQCRKKMRAIENGGAINNQDSAFITHAWHNQYSAHELENLLIESMIDKSVGQELIGFPLLFAHHINSKIESLVGLNDVSTVRKSYGTAIKAFGARYAELGNVLRKEEQIEFIISHLKALRTEEPDIGFFFNQLVKESAAWANRLSNKQQNKIGSPERKFQRITIHILLARDLEKPTDWDTVASVKMYEFTPESDQDIFERITGRSGIVLKELRSGELLIKPDNHINLTIGHDANKVIIEGEETLYCITPACDILRPVKVDGFMKFIRGILVRRENVGKLLKAEKKQGSSVYQIRFKDRDGSECLVRLGFGNVKSMPVQEGLTSFQPSRPKDTESDNLGNPLEEWSGWKSLIVLKSEYAHDVASRYLSYHSRPGIDDFDW